MPLESSAEPVAEGAAADPAPAPTPQADPGPRLYGVIDVVKPDRIAGWAIDRGDAAAAVEVEIRREGKPIRTVRADRHRADLAKGGVGTGDYGFRAEIDPPIEAGLEFTLTAVARTADGVEAELSRVGPALRSADPSLRVVERVYEEVTRLREALRRSEARAAEPEARAIAETLERVELVQARIEAALAAAPDAPQPARDAGLKAIALAALATAALSLGVGIWSMLVG
jgi:hypothetical protein